MSKLRGCCKHFPYKVTCRDCYVVRLLMKYWPKVVQP